MHLPAAELADAPSSNELRAAERAFATDSACSTADASQDASVERADLISERAERHADTIT